MALVLLLTAICCAVLNHGLAHDLDTKGQTNEKFLMVLFDGLRWNYLDFEGLDNFKRLEKTGVRANYMQPDFPSLSYPGYYTILTGLHSENHGFVGNNMYDPDKNKFFDVNLGGDSLQPYWWEQAEPLWTASTRAGKKTHVYLWPGCDVPIHGVLPTFCQRYEYFNDTQRLEENLVDVVDKFANDAADVGFIYTEYTDDVGHKFGPDSDEVKMAMSNLNRIVGNLLDNLDKKSLTNKVNIIFVSDHGMTLMDQDKHKYTSVPIAEVVNVDYVDWFIEGGALMGIRPKPEFLDQVYDSLKDIPCFHVWKKENIPENLHYRHNNRISPIVIAAKPMCIIGKVRNSTKQWPLYNPDPTKSKRETGGGHGFLPEENKDMRAIFLAKGPAIIEKGGVAAIYSIDVYNLAVHVMGIQGHPNNGTWSHVSNMLRSSSSAASSFTRFTDVTYLMLFGLFFVFRLPTFSIQ